MKDSMRLEAPAAQKELEWLKGLKVGDKRESILFPAFEVGMEWVCTAVEATRCELEGRFFGQLVYAAVIEVGAEFLTLTVKES